LLTMQNTKIQKIFFFFFFFFFVKRKRKSKTKQLPSRT
jgi:hypothetical protein